MLRDKLSCYTTLPYQEIHDYFNCDIGIAFDTTTKLSEVGSSNQKIRQFLSSGRPCLVPRGTNEILSGCNFVRFVDPGDTFECLDAIKSLRDSMSVSILLKAI